MARKKRRNNINIDDIESGYNIIRKYWKILRNSSTYFDNSINNINTIRI